MTDCLETACTESVRCSLNVKVSARFPEKGLRWRSCCRDPSQGYKTLLSLLIQPRIPWQHSMHRSVADTEPLFPSPRLLRIPIGCRKSSLRSCESAGVTGCIPLRSFERSSPLPDPAVCPAPNRADGPGRGFRGLDTGNQGLESRDRAEVRLQSGHVTPQGSRTRGSPTVMI